MKLHGIYTNSLGEVDGYVDLQKTMRNEQRLVVRLSFLTGMRPR